MYQGKRILKQPGKAGRVRVVYRVRFENGRQTNQRLLRREVLAAPHEKIVDLGAKKIYVYKDIKITFIDGKVTDVQ